MLNPQQTAAAKYIDGPLLVLAGAGSGKTRVITQKIAYLLEDCGYPANGIYAVTFTNKAANEMRERVALSTPAAKRRGLKISTFHSLGLEIIKREVSICGLKRGFSIYDSDDTQHVLRNLLPKATGSCRDYLMQAQHCISSWKTELLSPEEALAQCTTGGDIEIATLYQQYQQALQAYNAVDFDDLMRLPTVLLRDSAEVRERWQNKVRYLLVDEYQDSNTCQYLLVKLLTGVSARFTVVGDDDQSIYAWRGAKPENLAQLQRDYRNLNVIKLEQNYRSSGIILNAANRLIANNEHLFSKKLWSSLGQGDFIRILCCRDELNEAEQVVADLISHRIHNNTQYGDYAILYRGNHQSRLFEKTLRHHSVPYRISGGQSWFSRKEIKDVFAYFKLVCNEADDASFMRVINTPKRGIGDTSLRALGQYAQVQDKSLYNAADNLALGELLADKPRQALLLFKGMLDDKKQQFSQGNIPEILRDLVDAIGYEAYLHEQCETPQKAQRCMENVLELLAWIERMLEKEEGASLADVINKIILIDLLDKNDDQDADTLQLMTLHASKGLEFPYVYLVGMEEELLPHRSSIESDDISEERRLAYVGITRAQKNLNLSFARRRRRGGEIHACTPSRFLEELPQDYLEWVGRDLEQDPENSKKQAQSHLAGLKALLS